MKSLAAAVACVVLAACASGSAGPEGTATGRTPQPNVQLVQLTGPADLNYPPDQFEVQLGVLIENRSAEPITLRQIVMEPVGAGGPYRILRERYFFKREIAGSQSDELGFWARAVATGSADAIDANAPVTVRALLYFDSPAGALRKVVVANLGQARRRF